MLPFIQQENYRVEEKRTNNVNSISWPAQSPDMDLIEHYLWDELEIARKL